VIGFDTITQIADSVCFARRSRLLPEAAIGLNYNSLEQLPSNSGPGFRLKTKGLKATVVGCSAWELILFLAALPN